MSFEKTLSIPRASSAPEKAGKKSWVHGQKTTSPRLLSSAHDFPGNSLSLKNEIYLRITNVLGSLF